jgi:hypothetical protein
LLGFELAEIKILSQGKGEFKRATADLILGNVGFVFEVIIRIGILFIYDTCHCKTTTPLTQHKNYIDPPAKDTHFAWDIPIYVGGLFGVTGQAFKKRTNA